MAAMAAAPLHLVITATVPTARIDRIEGVLSTCFVGVRFRPTCNRSSNVSVYEIDIDFFSVMCMHFHTCSSFGEARTSRMLHDLGRYVFELQVQSVIRHLRAIVC